MGRDAAVQEVRDSIAIECGIGEEFRDDGQSHCETRQNGRIMLTHVVAVLYGVGKSLVKSIKTDIHVFDLRYFFSLSTK